MGFLIAKGRRFKTVVALAAGCLLGAGLLVLLASAQDLNGGTLRGHLTAGAQDEPVAGVDVALTWMQGGQQQSKSATTDSGGAYTFYDLPLLDEISFKLSAVVKGKTVERPGIALSTWTPEIVADLQYHDTSSDSTHIHAGRMTVVLPPGAAEGPMNVIEFVEIHNDSDINFAVPDDQGREIGFRLGLPASATQISIEGNELVTAVEGTTVLLVEPLKPRNTVLTMSYVVPTGERVDLSRPIYYLIEEAVVLIGEPAFEMTSSGFEPGEPASIHGEQYATLRRHGVQAGTTLALGFKRGAARASAASSGGGGGIPVVPAILVLLLALLTGGGLGVLIMQARRGGASSGPSGGAVDGDDSRSPVLLDTGMLKRAEWAELESLKQLHLGVIADLDERHRSGSFPTDLYHTLRGEQKARLGQVLEEQGFR